MDTAACTAGLALASSTLLVLGALSLLVGVLGLQRSRVRRQARRAASARVAARLVGYQLAATLRRRYAPLPGEWSVLASAPLLVATAEDHAATPWLADDVATPRASFRGNSATVAEVVGMPGR